MNISIPKEQTTGELRVAATPSSVAQLIKLGFDVAVEQGAGKRANFSDSDYEQAGATIKSKKQIFTGDVILKVNASQGEYAVRFEAVAYEVNDLVSQHSCLPRPGSRDDECRSIFVDYGITLLRVEQVKVIESRVECICL